MARLEGGNPSCAWGWAVIGFRVWGLGLGVWGVGFRVQGLAFFPLRNCMSVLCTFWVITIPPKELKVYSFGELIMHSANKSRFRG